MADALPFVTFNFRVNLEVPGSGVLCQAAFSDCDGLEMSMAPKTIREGGNNTRPIHLAGPVTYGQLTLKRGMTADFALWRWFDRSQRERSVRASGEIHVLTPEGERKGEVAVKFSLTNCLPVKIKAPALSAKDGLIAIEEMQLVYETLALEEG
jgi:phage tail-like protein